MGRTVERLPVSAIINVDSAEIPAGYPWWRRWLLGLAYKSIHAYQKDKYPQSERTKPIHSMVHLGDGYVLNVTWPKAKIHRLELSDKETYSFWLWTGAGRITSAAQVEMRRRAEELEGHEYDTLQLAGIGWQRVFAKILMRILPPPYNAKIGELLTHKTLLGFGKARTVCSAGAHVVLLALYKFLKAAGIDVERPLGDQWVEITCPADFENHPSFTEIVL